MPTATAGNRRPLTDRQIATARVLVMYPNKPKKEIMEEMKVPSRTFYDWLKNPEFQEKMFELQQSNETPMSVDEFLGNATEEQIELMKVKLLGGTDAAPTGLLIEETLDLLGKVRDLVGKPCSPGDLDDLAVRIRQMYGIIRFKEGWIRSYNQQGECTNYIEATRDELREIGEFFEMALAVEKYRTKNTNAEPDEAKIEEISETVDFLDDQIDETHLVAEEFRVDDPYYRIIPGTKRRQPPYEPKTEYYKQRRRSVEETEVASAS